MKPLFQMSQAELQQAARLARGAVARARPNPAAALDLEHRAASMGHPRAMCKLGDRYARGDGVQQWIIGELVGVLRQVGARWPVE